MPVIDETIHTLEIKALKKVFLERLEALEKRLEVVEGKSKAK